MEALQLFIGLLFEKKNSNKKDQNYPTATLLLLPSFLKSAKMEQISIYHWG